MPQTVFVKVAGFDDVERHALNTMFRLSADREVAYVLWMHDAPQPPKLALVDGDSYEALLDIGTHADPAPTVIWIGDAPPKNAWRTFERPIAWHDVVSAMDELFAPAPAAADLDLDFDLDIDAGAQPAAATDAGAEADAGVDFDLDGDVVAHEDAQDTQPPDTLPPEAEEPRKRALIANADRDERLYLRAKLALSGLTHADEAETGAQALELARSNAYTVAIVDFKLPDIDGWAMLRELSQARPAIAHIIVTTPRLSLRERIRSWFADTDGFFEKPTNTARLQDVIERIR
jgi:CheY-like chemotaxis protein